MAFESISPNMNLPVPGVGLTDGPQWALDVNECFNLIDVHDHTPGQGVQITAAGININTEFPVNDNDITEIRSARFTSQGSPLALPADLGCIYVSGADLYYNDTAGNQVRITQSGAVVGTPGSITALTAPASATYVAGNGTFVWQQAVNTAANMDMASAIIRKDTVSSDGITIKAPVALSADYDFVLPASLPAVNSYMAIDTSGNITTAQPVAPNIQTSASCGTVLYTSPTVTPVAVPNLSVTLTTTGRPVVISVQGDAANPAGVQIHDGGDIRLSILRDATEVQRNFFRNQPSGYTLTIPPPGLIIDTPVAGTYTYSVQTTSLLFQTVSSTFTLFNLKLVAYEL